MTDARYRLLDTMQDLMSNYLVDECPDNVMWEDFDPDIDGLRSTITDLIDKHCRATVSAAEQHYSDRTLRVLIDKHGWEPVDSGGPLHTVQRQFVGVGPIGTMITPDGERNFMAGYSADSERRRFIALSLGPNQIADFDGRDENPEYIARLINWKAEQYADEHRERQGLNPLYAIYSFPASSKGCRT